jgi:hypothetical protein
MWGIKMNAIRPVWYAADWGFADGMGVATVLHGSAAVAGEGPTAAG